MLNIRHHINKEKAEAVRVALAAEFPYEFEVVDGGDGSASLIAHEPKALSVERFKDRFAEMRQFTSVFLIGFASGYDKGHKEGKEDGETYLQTYADGWKAHETIEHLKSL